MPQVSSSSAQEFEPSSSVGSPVVNPPSPEVGGPYAYYVLGVLFVVYIFNFIDRQILAILLEPIKQDLQISDTALGFLTGFAFAVFYTFAGLPLARIADQWVRRSLIAISLTTWSVMTAASGLARGFTDLALTRIGVGVGEAGASTLTSFRLFSSRETGDRFVLLCKRHLCRRWLRVLAWRVD